MGSRPGKQESHKHTHNTDEVGVTRRAQGKQRHRQQMLTRIQRIEGCNGDQAHFCAWPSTQNAFPGLPHGSPPHQLSKSQLKAWQGSGAPLTFLLPNATPPHPSPASWVLFILFCFVSPTPHGTHCRLTDCLVHFYCLSPTPGRPSTP